MDVLFLPWGGGGAEEEGLGEAEDERADVGVRMC
jgi:hypothetical protein